MKCKTFFISIKNYADRLRNYVKHPVCPPNIIVLFYFITNSGIFQEGNRFLCQNQSGRGGEKENRKMSEKVLTNRLGCDIIQKSSRHNEICASGGIGRLARFRF